MSIRTIRHTFTCQSSGPTAEEMEGGLDELEAAVQAYVAHLPVGTSVSYGQLVPCPAYKAVVLTQAVITCQPTRGRGDLPLRTAEFAFTTGEHSHWWAAKQRAMAVDRYWASLRQCGIPEAAITVERIQESDGNGRLTCIAVVTYRSKFEVDPRTGDPVSKE